MPIPLVVSIVGDASKLTKELDSAGASAKGFGSKIDAGVLLKGAAIAGVVTIAADALIQLGNAAADDAREAAALELALKGAGAATGDWQAQVESAIATGEDLAFTDTQIRDALTTLSAATGSMAESTEGLALAQDVARLKGIDLAQATDAVAKAQGGNATALAKLLKISTEGASATDILSEAQKLAMGQAELYGDSQAGAADKASIKFAELGEKIGTAVVPILEILTEHFLVVIDVVADVIEEIGPGLTEVLRAIAPVLGGFVRGVGEIIKAIAGLVSWLADAVEGVFDLIDALAALNPFAEKVSKSVGRLGDLNGPGYGMVAGPAAVTGGTLNLTVNGGDPDAIVRAIARWAGRNGGRAAFDRMIER